jgi:DoxX
LQDDDLRAAPIMQWLLPSVEFGGGCALIVGLLSVLAAFGLFVICVGPLSLDAVKRMRTWQPLDRADWLGDLRPRRPVQHRTDGSHAGGASTMEP